MLHARMRPVAVEHTIDLSALTDEELDLLDRLAAKVQLSPA
jgi:hypothetical protein